MQQPCAHCFQVALTILLILMSTVGAFGVLKIAVSEVSMTFGTSQAVYDDALPYFVGGYTVAGNAMSRDGLSSFSVQQECL